MCILIICILIVIILIIRNYYLRRILFKYESIIEEQGKKIHEYNNQLLVIKAYINNKKKLNDYLNTIIEDCRVGQNYEIRQLQYLEEGLKTMIIYKLNKIYKNKINFSPYIQKETKKYFKKFNVILYSNITKIVGVLLDNAIYEASLTTDKDLFFDIKNDGNYIVIKVSNSTLRTKIGKIGHKNYSTKGKGHGFGLLLVKDILKHNKKLELVTDIRNNYFIQTLLIDIR